MLGDVRCRQRLLMTCCVWQKCTSQKKRRTIEPSEGRRDENRQRSTDGVRNRRQISTNDIRTTQIQKLELKNSVYSQEKVIKKDEKHPEGSKNQKKGNEHDGRIERKN